MSRNKYCNQPIIQNKKIDTKYRIYKTIIHCGWGNGNSIEPRSAITIIHNVLISYECIYENYENILSILDKKKLDSREKTDFLL